MFRTLFAKSWRHPEPPPGARGAAKGRDEPPATDDSDFRPLVGPFCGQQSRHRMLVLLDEKARRKVAEGGG